MAIRAMLDTLDGVDAPIAALYSEQTIAGATKYVLDVEGVDAMPQVRGLKVAHDATKAKLTTANTELAAAKARLEGLPDDFDADHYEQMKTAADKGTKAPDPAEIERQVAARVAKETKKESELRKAAEERATKLQAQRDTTERNRVLSDELAKAGVTDPDFAAAARIMLSSGTKVVENDDGTIAVLGTDAEFGTDVPISQLVTDWAKSSAGKKFVAAPNSQGGGAGGGGNGKPGSTGQFTKENFNYTEFGKLRRENPQEAKRIALALGKGELVDDL